DGHGGTICTGNIAPDGDSNRVTTFINLLGKFTDGDRWSGNKFQTGHFNILQSLIIGSTAGSQSKRRAIRGPIKHPAIRNKPVLTIGRIFTEEDINRLHSSNPKPDTFAIVLNRVSLFIKQLDRPVSSRSRPGTK